MDKERYFECLVCGAVVQGWNAAHWWDNWHEENCEHLDSDVIEIEDDEQR